MKNKFKIGDKVVDNDGLTGIINEVDNIHNIEVKYDNFIGSGLYCIDKKCAEYDKLKHKNKKDKLAK